MNTSKNKKARHLRKNMTDVERVLWNRLRQRQLEGFKFRRQQPMGNYIVDFLCFEQKLIIELDGGQHLEQESHDKIRTAWLEKEGFRVLRFWNHEVLQETEAVIEEIAAILNTPHPNLPPQVGKEASNRPSQYKDLSQKAGGLSKFCQNSEHL